MKSAHAAQCPGMPSSRQLSFDNVLKYAADISAAHRSLEAQECFSLAVALAADDKDRNIALYNLAVVQMDLRRSSSFTRITFRLCDHTTTTSSFQLLLPASRIPRTTQIL
jgi:hypothetical protein